MGVRVGVPRKGGTSEAIGLNDLRIAQRLHRALAGSPECEVALGRSVAPRCPHRDYGLAIDQLRPFRACESEKANSDMTAPGAVLAMGLFYIQTNSVAAAEWLRLPDTRVLINTVRPDLQLLRVVARSLILWDAIVFAVRASSRN